MSILSLIIFVGISVSRHALAVSSFKIYLRVSSPFIFEKENDSLDWLLHTSPIANIWDNSYIFQHILKQDH